jgi:hypothetical protein
VLPIIDSTIRKILDLENSRGLAMAELGEIDLLMNAIIVAVHDGSDEGKVFIRGKIKERLDSYVESLSKRVNDLDSRPIQDAADLLDSAKRVMIMKSICKKFQINSHRDLLDSCGRTVLFPRNCLAHGIPREVSGGFIFRHNNEDFEFNDEASANLRNNLRSFRRCLEELREEITKALRV